MKRQSVFVGLLLLSSSLVYLACVGDTPVVVVVPDAGTDTGGGSDAAAEVAPPANCPQGCLPLAPQGWTGPSAVFDGPSADKPSNCPAQYTQKEVEAHQGITAAPATCNCGDPTMANNGLCTATMEGYTASNCTGNVLALAGFNTGDCKNPNNTYPSVKLAAPTLVDAGGCSFPDAGKTLPPPTFAKQDVACGPSQATACPSAAQCVSAPVPAAPFTRVCIHKGGDVACPSADYSNRFVAYRSVADTRDCTACTGKVTGGTCATGWHLVGNINQCNQFFANDKTAGVTCTTMTGTQFAAVSLGVTGATCTPSGGAPFGTADNSDPVTFCCNN